MPKNQHLISLKEIPKLVVFAFGIALALFMIAPFGAMVFSGGRNAFDPNIARIVFGVLFLVSLLYMIVSRIRSNKEGPSRKV